MLASIQAPRLQTVSAGASEYGELNRKFQESKDSFSSLADNEEWLADNFDKMIHTSDEEQPSPTALATEEEHVLRCLGAAVIMQWNTIPTKLQRELFDTAGSLGDVVQTVALRGQIARFLHSHKDKVIPADGTSKPNMDERNV